SNNQAGRDQERERDRERVRERLNLRQGQSVAEHVYRGVANALLHVKNPVARAALTAILEGKSVGAAVYEAKQLLPTWGDSKEIATVAEQLEEAIDGDVTLETPVRLQLKKHVGTMYFKAGQLNKARDLLAAILEQEPGETDAYQQLDRVCAASGDFRVKVFVKGKALGFADVGPRIEDGRVLVPVRALAEALGADVDYENGVVNIRNRGTAIRLVIGSREAQVDGATVYLDVPARVVEGRTLIPLRFVGEKFQARVDYFGGSNLVVVQPL
ncbi:MAG: copper amine oxidase N-terminal domain-containing protein, partial [Moorella sp. (in: Bacteria)]|nr:copper amine oxidase N-terminal domain-containing protein [Moorella sp. (in: firmicutes)]